MLSQPLKNKKVAVAVSGGEDSVALLDMICKLPKGFCAEVCVINVDHNIRQESAADSLFVKQLAAKYGVPFFGFSVDAPAFAKEKKLSEETAARILRYDVFDNFKECDVIALAHHASDQAESILMHILRGSGTKGAVGMRVQSGKYVRPLLDTPKEEIKKYVKDNKLSFVVDKTNFENDKTRNFLRNEIMPLLEKLNPNAASNICRFGRNAAADQALIEELAAKRDITLHGGEVLIPNDAAKDGEALYARHVFKAAKLLGVFADIEYRHVADVFALAKDGQSGMKLDLPHEITVFKDYDGVVLTRQKPRQFDGGEVAFCEDGVRFDGFEVHVSDEIGNGLRFDLEKLPSHCVVRHRRDGDVFCKFGGGTKKLKEFLIDKKIPSRFRDGLVLVAKDKEVFVICGVEISDKIKVDGDSRKVRQITAEENTNENA